MAKNYGHTQTLFIQGGKYKWSYKYNYCSSCLTVKFPHKGNGLCASCFDINRNKKRKGQCKYRSWRWHYKTKIFTRLENKVEWRKAPGIKSTGFNIKEYRKKYYRENKEVLLLISKANTRRRQGLDCLEIMVNGKSKYFPFSGIPEKPCSRDHNNQEWQEYRKIQKQFNILYKWYHK